MVVDLISMVVTIQLSVLHVINWDIDSMNAETKCQVLTVVFLVMFKAVIVVGLLALFALPAMSQAISRRTARTERMLIVITLSSDQRTAGKLV